MLDFIFTRLYQFYEKREQESNSVFSSSIYISVLRILLFYSLVMMLDIFSGGRLSVSNLQVNKTLLKLVFVLAFISMMFLDYKRYKKKHKEFLAKYKNSSSNRWFKIWMVGALIVILFLSPILWNEIFKLFN